MKLKKLIPAAIFSAALLFSPVVCSAEEESLPDGTQSLGSGGIYFGDGYSLEYAYINSKTEISVTACSGEAVEVEIPLTIDNLPVTDIGEGAFYQCGDLTRVTMGDKVTTINAGAFFSCELLEEIGLSDQLKTIDYQAFYGCSALTEFSIPATLTSLGDGVFEGCTALGSIDVADGNTVYSDADGVLYNRDQTTLIKFPEGADITAFTIPETVTEIRNNACYGAQKLQEVSLPASLTTLGQYVFEGCPALESIHVSAENKTYAAQDGVLFTKDLSTLIKFPEQCALTEYRVPDSTKKLENWSFVGAEKLETIDLNQVTEIGEDCFYYCTALKSITIPESVTKLNGACFAYCTALSEVNLPDGLTTIGPYCFVNCESLKTVSLPSSLTQIGTYALGYNYDNETGATAVRDDFGLIVSVGSIGADYAESNNISYTKSGMTLAIVLGAGILLIAVAILIIALISRKRAMTVRPAKSANKPASDRKDQNHE